MVKVDLQSLRLNQIQENKRMTKAMKNVRRALKLHTEMLKHLIQEQENMKALIGSWLPCSNPASDNHGSDDYVDFSMDFSDSMSEEEENIGVEDDYDYVVPELATDSETASLVDDDDCDSSVPVFNSEHIEESFIKMAIKVVKGYNSNQGTSFKFQKLSSVASTYDRGVRYYFMYIEVKDSDAAADSSPVVFHAEISDYGCGEGCVEACEIQDQY